MEAPTLGGSPPVGKNLLFCVLLKRKKPPIYRSRPGPGRCLCKLWLNELVGFYSDRLRRFGTFLLVYRHLYTCNTRHVNVYVRKSISAEMVGVCNAEIPRMCFGIKIDKTIAWGKSYRHTCLNSNEISVTGVGSRAVYRFGAQNLLEQPVWSPTPTRASLISTSEKVIFNPLGYRLYANLNRYLSRILLLPITTRISSVFRFWFCSVFFFFWKNDEIEAGNARG